MLFAFLTGCIVLNVLKEELPEERESSLWAFATGAAVYAVLLLIAFLRPARLLGPGAKRKGSEMNPGAQTARVGFETREDP